jgi:hypothetical protein
LKHTPIAQAPSTLARAGVCQPSSEHRNVAKADSKTAVSSDQLFLCLAQCLRHVQRRRSSRHDVLTFTRGRRHPSKRQGIHISCLHCPEWDIAPLTLAVGACCWKHSSRMRPKTHSLWPSAAPCLRPGFCPHNLDPESATGC